MDHEPTQVEVAPPPAPVAVVAEEVAAAPAAEAAAPVAPAVEEAPVAPAADEAPAAPAAGSPPEESSAADELVVPSVDGSLPEGSTIIFVLGESSRAIADVICLHEANVSAVIIILWMCQAAC